jgi:Ca2+-binding EF-hand superfamily protein
MAADEQPADPSSYDNMPPPAAGSTAEAAPLFLQLDSDQDGYVSKDEAKRSADTAAQFDDLDANHDGKISATEFGAAGAK